jgi:serralysin
MPTLDGNLDDWTADTRLDTPATGAEGFAIYGDLVGDTYFFAISSSVPIGPNTTIWLDTDLNRATGFQVFGGTTGADYNINIAGDGTLALYTGAAGETAVATSLTYAYRGGRKISTSLQRC